MEEEDEKDEKAINMHIHSVQWNLAKKLTEYLNFCIKEKSRLLYNQDLLQQIYLPKDNSEWKTFYNERPITKTSPMYKLLDTILNNILQRELYSGKEWKLNEGQTGFRRGMGCEINLLRITE